ncbi:hypothetical protein PFISCL1PPCAC_15690, partial [Pristionchus fissidentatus]
DSGWDLTKYAGANHSNSNSNCSMAGLEWMNKVDLTKFQEQITPDIIQKFNDSNTEASSDNSKPAWSYSCMVALAIKSSLTGELAVSDIYKFICAEFPYFQNAPPGWKNSVRHNLSLNKSFLKTEVKSDQQGRKSCLWSIRPEKMAKV